MGPAGDGLDYTWCSVFSPHHRALSAILRWRSSNLSLVRICLADPASQTQTGTRNNWESGSD